ncbi:hypothetical protein [Amycolatopsis circi]|uniref:hypothetical protein n=1 Tax=Amycolatopsis circi TaxID=871959 RepID=UPI000E2798D2|nr:hypothetical protein [Amycolatopsis circi]
MLVVGAVLLAETVFAWSMADASSELRVYPSLLFAVDVLSGVLGAGWLGVGAVVLIAVAPGGALLADPDEALDRVPGVALIMTSGGAIALFQLPIPAWAAILGILVATGIATASGEILLGSLHLPCRNHGVLAGATTPLGLARRAGPDLDELARVALLSRPSRDAALQAPTAFKQTDETRRVHLACCPPPAGIHATNACLTTLRATAGKPGRLL